MFLSDMKSSLFTVLLLIPLLLTSCGGESTAQLSSNILPTKSVDIAKEDSSSCIPVTNPTFDGPRHLHTDEGDYTLIGIQEKDTPAENTDSFLAGLAERIYCVGHDSMVDLDNYVYIYDKDISLLNTEIIRLGYANAFTESSYIYKDYFIGLEKEAQTQTTLSSGKKSLDTKSNAIQDSIGQEISSRIVVESIGKTDDMVYLNSTKDYTSKDNVALVLRKTKDAIFALYPERYLGDTIEFRGVPQKKDGHIVIELNSEDDMVVIPQ